MEIGLASSARRRDAVCGERVLGMRDRRFCVWEEGSWRRGGLVVWIRGDGSFNRGRPCSSSLLLLLAVWCCFCC